VIGSRVGPYRVVSELGSGGMGTVYLVEDADGTKFALKVVHPNLMGMPGFAKRFMREAEIGKRIRQENVVATFDADGIEIDDRTTFFLAMEYVEGQTLRELVDELGPVPEELCRHIGREVSKGLVAIHDAGVVHRDLKPENILITKDHTVKIMDLGVAHLVDEVTRLSQAGSFVGSVLYAAPEQFTGDEIEARSDLYTLGLVLYVLATGQHPFQSGDPAGIMAQHMHEVPRPVAELNPQLSPFLEELIRVLVAKEPRGRFDSAAELLDVLERGEATRWWRERAAAIRMETKRPLRRIRIPRETALYGRDKALAKLRELYEQVRVGRGHVVLVEGEAGIGKTRLVDEFVASLEREDEDLNFLFGSYPPGGAATMAGAFATAYREHFGSEGLEGTLRDYLQETPVLIPAFAALLRGEPSPKGEESLSKDSLQTVFVRATHSLARERPTVVLIDDLHFAPEEGLALMAALSLVVPGHPVLLVGTARPGLPEEWVAGVERQDHVTRMPLARLGPKDLGALLVEALGSEHLAMELGFQIATKSDGNPFFAFEILRGLREEQLITQRSDGSWVMTQAIEQIQIPSSVLDLIQARISDLEEEDRDLLDVAACCGFEFDPGLVADAVGINRIPALKRLGRIERTHRLIRSAGLRFVFDHHQIQEALYGRLPGMLRQEYHAALGKALERREAAAEKQPKDLDGAMAADLCDHLLKGGCGENALRYLEPALDHLDENYLNDAALRLADHALDERGLLTGRTRVAILLRKVERLHNLGWRARERTALHEALAIADESGDPLLRSRVRRALGIHYWRLARYEDARTRLTEARSFAGEAADRKLEARAAGDLGNVFLHLGSYEEAGRHYAPQLALSTEIGDRLGEGRATGNLGVVAMNVGRHEESQQRLERALALALEVGDRRGEALAMGNLGALFVHLGRPEEAREHMERHLLLARETGKRQVEANATANLGILFLQLGRYQEAKQRFERHLALCLEIDERRAAAIALSNLGSLEAALGNLPQGRDSLEESLKVLQQLGAREWEGLALHRLGALAEQQGDGDTARRLYGEALTLRREIGFRLGIAETLTALGRVEENPARLAEALALARDLQAPATVVLAAAHASLLPEGDVDVALAALKTHEARIGPADRMEARFALSKATGDPAHLEEAHRLLLDLREHAPAESRPGMIRNVPLHSEIAAAWESRRA